MILRSLNIIKSELNQYLAPHFAESETIVLGNIGLLESNSPGSGTSVNALDGKVVITLVSIQEEKTLKNLPHHRKQGDGTVYKNPPVYLNLIILISANSSSYDTSLKYLSLIIKFFQSKNTFTHRDAFEQNLDPIANQEATEPFRMVLDLHATTFEESNYLWSTLGGKQLPSVCYKVRVLALERDLVQSTSPLIKEIQIKEN